MVGSNHNVRTVMLSACECGGEIAICEKPYIHQKVDLPEIKTYVVEYQLEHGHCRKCGKSSKLPEGVTSDTFEPRVKSIITAFSGFYKNSKRGVLFTAKTHILHNRSEEIHSLSE